jgi:RNA-directed DNA polymerase
VAEVRYLATRPRCYDWVVEGDIKACFDEIDHTALMGRVRRRVGDNRVLGLVKAFLKAGILTEAGLLEDSTAGTPQGSLCSAEHKDPYEQRRVMRSAGRQGLVTAILGVDHCA